MKHLKLFFALFAMLALGVGNAWAETVEFDLTTKTQLTTQTANSVVFTNGGATLTITKSASGTAVNNYMPGGTTNASHTRVYKTNPITFDVGTGNKIQSVTVKVTSSSGAIDKITNGTWNPTVTNSGTSSPITYTLSTTSQTASVTPSGTSRIEKVTLTYVSEGGSTPDPEPDPDPTPDPEPEPDPTPDPGNGGEALSYTWDLSTNSYSAASNNQVTWSAADVNMVIDKASAQTNANNYLPTAKTSTRFYTNSKLTITPAANVTITSVVFTATSTGYAGALQGSTWTNASASVSGTTVTVTPTNGASAISATIGGTCGFTGVTVHYTKAASGEPENPTPSVSVAPASYTFATTNVRETATQEFTITAKNTEATLSASIDNTTDFAVSAITGDKVTVTYQPQSAGDHTATMTVKAGEEASTTVALTGKAVAALEGTWILVTDASSLNVGDKIIIAAKEYDVALSTTQNNNNRGEVAITKKQNTITATSEAQVLTLQAGTKEGSLALSTGAGYLHAASSSDNYLRTETTLSDNSSWKVTIAADGTATLIAQGTNTRNTLYYNKNSKIFSCYSNAQQPIALYKNTNGKQLAGLAYATTKYLTKLGDAFATPALTNPNSLAVTYSSSDNNVATVADDGTITIKAAGVVVITAAFAGDASYLEGSAKYTLCVTEHAGTEVDPYSVADARRVIDVMETAEGVYATGIVSEIVTAYDEQYGNITYNISIDGSTAADQLQAYRGKGVNGENFSSANDIKVGDEVIVKGNLKKYNTTYEFDEENQLVSLKREKQQAGLAYEEKEHTANVGEDFTEPTLTNPNRLTVTYSSSNTALATVDATTGEVSILAAGKVTITASSAADATYAAGSASYNITISDPSLAVATLPFAFNGNKAAIETTAGMTQNGLGSDYSASTAPNSQLKFDGKGDWVVIRFDSEPEKLSYDIKNNTFSEGTFSVQESVDGETYTDVKVHTEITETQSEEHTLLSTSRYVKFIYTEKVNGNVGLGNIKITKPDNRADAGLAWNPATVSLTVGDAFTAPTFNNPNGLSGITFASSNEALATVNNAGAITLVSGKTGTATITATFADGHAKYKPAEATCVITVSPKSEKVVILAQYGDQWYALKAAYLSGKTDRLDAIPVNYVGGKLYNVAEADKASIEWSSVVEGDKVSFLNDGKYLKGKTSTTLLVEEDADGLYQWDNTTYTMTIGTTVRSFLYNGEAFRNFAVSNAGKVVNDVLYSSLPVVTAPVYATGDAYGRSVNLGEDGYRYGTICLPFGSKNFTGAEFFECVGKEEGKVYIASVTTLVAGTPYIFLASATEVAVYGDGTTAATPGSKNGLVGTFTNDTEVAIGNYILKDNALCQAEAICWVNANRAYLVMEDVPGEFTKMPGRRYIGMDVEGENEATGFDNIQLPNANSQKLIINGQLIIIRDGEMYNAQGVRF